MSSDTTTKSAHWSLAGALGAGLLASACCTLPLVLVMLGVGGAWLSTLRALEPLRPLFVALAVGLLFFAYRRVATRSGLDVCEPGSACTKPETKKRNLLVLGVAALVTMLLIVSPAIISWMLTP